MEQEEQPYFSSLSTDLKISEQENIKFILPHEHLFSTISEETTATLTDIEEMSLETIQKIRQNPLRCLRNLSINSIEESHYEMQQFLQASLSNNITSEQILIIETTTNLNGQDSAKLTEIQRLTNVKIAKGLTFHCPRIADITEEKAKVLFSPQNIFQQLTFELDMGTDGQKPAFLGEIELTSQKEGGNSIAKLIQDNSLTAYLKLCKTKRIPLWIELNQSQDTTVIDQLVSNVSQQDRHLIVLFNPKIIIDQVLDVNTTQNVITHTHQIQNIQQIISILSHGFTLGFDILRYQENLQLLTGFFSYIIQKGFIKQLLLSNGVKYKSDLVKYGGSGYAGIFDIIKSLKLSQEQFKQLFRDNLLKLLNWNSFKIEVKVVTLWTCPQCNKQFPDTIEKFSKFGKEFCSIQCLKKAVK